MEGVRNAAVFNGVLRCGQGLSKYLPTKHIFRSNVTVLTTEQIIFKPFQREHLVHSEDALDVVCVGKIMWPE